MNTLTATATGSRGDGPDGEAGAASAARLRPGSWAAYAACAWVCVFAAMSFYWAAGGSLGADTIGGSIQRLGQARDPGFVALLWGIGVVKALGGLLALALVRPWGRAVPRRLLLIAAWAAGLGMAAYGALQLLVTGGAVALMLAGILSTDGVNWAAIRWHVLLWDPWWLLGGVLFIMASLWRPGAPGADRVATRRVIRVGVGHVD
jgi:hypothetical protein